MCNLLSVPLGVRAKLRTSKSFVRIHSRELRSISTRSSITFSNAGGKHAAWWVWFLLTFPFITYFAQTSTGGNKNLLSLHARSNFTTLDMMQLLSLPSSSLSILNSFPWGKEPCPNTLLANPFYAGISWSFLASFYTSRGDEDKWGMWNGNGSEEQKSILATREPEDWHEPWETRQSVERRTVGCCMRAFSGHCRHLCLCTQHFLRLFCGSFSVLPTKSCCFVFALCLIFFFSAFSFLLQSLWKNQRCEFSVLF